MLIATQAAMLHYRCVFDLQVDSNDSFGWSEIIKLFRSWVSFRNPDERFGGRWFFTGGELKPHEHPGVFVKTARAIGDGTEDRPQFWTARFEKQDAEITYRRWRTDLGITCIGTHAYQFSLVTTHSLMPGFIGEEPPAPVPSAPYIVQMLLMSPHLRAFAGSELLIADPVPLIEGGGAEFRERLENPRRQCPIILVSRETDTGSLKINPEDLTRLLVGTATVFFSESRGVAEELEWMLPLKYSCRDGMVRVYQPKVRFDSDHDYRRHRFFTGEQIDELSPQVVVDAIVRGVARGAQMLATGGVTTIEDVADRESEQRFRELRARYVNQPELNQWIEDFDSENKRLKHKLEEVRKQNESLWQEVEQLEGDKSSLEHETVALNHTANFAREEANTLRETNRLLLVQTNAIQSIQQLPSSILEAVNLIELLHPDKIVFTEKAKSAAKAASFKDVDIAWQCLWSAATVLHALYFDPSTGSNNPQDAFKNQTAFELALTETGTTQNDSTLMAFRKIEYNGEVIDITPHIKYGTKPPKCFRIYYYPHPKEKRIIVGHCGDHLPTSGTRKL